MDSGPGDEDGGADGDTAGVGVCVEVGVRVEVTVAFAFVFEAATVGGASFPPGTISFPVERMSITPGPGSLIPDPVSPGSEAILSTAEAGDHSILSRQLNP